MLGRFSSSLGPVGIDFGARGVKMLQLRSQGEQLKVIGAARVDTPLERFEQPEKTPARPGSPKNVSNNAGNGPLTSFNRPDPHLIEQLRAAYSGGGFVGRKCVVSLARTDVSLQSIRLPKMPDDELRQTAMWEASQRFGFNRDAMEVDFIRTGATLQSGDNKEEVILIAASQAAIHARLEPLLAIGLRPIALDTGFAALVRTFSRRTRRHADLDTVRAVVEIGCTGSTVLILRGDQIAFCKPFPISGNDFNRAVAEHLQMDEHAAAELRAARMEWGQASAANIEAQSSSLTLQARADVTTCDVTQAADPSTDRAVFEAVRPIMGELIKEVTLCLRYYGVTFRGHPPESIILTGGDGLEPRLAELMAKACKTPTTFDDSSNTLSGLIGQIKSTLNRTPGPAACWAVAAGLSLRTPSEAKRVSQLKSQPASDFAASKQAPAIKPRTAGHAGVGGGGGAELKKEVA